MSFKNRQDLSKKSNKKHISIDMNHTEYDAHETMHQDLKQEHHEILEKNINRLSRNVKYSIKASVIISYLMLFTVRRFKTLFSLACIIAAFYCIFNSKNFITDMSVIANLEKNYPYIITIGLKFVGLTVGMIILRSSLLTQMEKNNTSFFHGFPSFIGLHILMHLIVIITTVTNTIIFDSFISQTLLDTFKSINPKNLKIISLMFSATLDTLTTTMFLTRFSFLIPSIISKRDDNLQNVTPEMILFWKPLFCIIFSIKFVCLNIILFSDLFLSDNKLLIVRTTFFVFYHIFIYSLLGVSYKLYNKLG